MSKVDGSDRVPENSVGWSDPKLLLDQWYKYEQIAMHFNDLLMRLRTQALGGVAAVATIGSAFVTGKGIPLAYLAALFGVLAALWCAGWLLDARYYSLLLVGAVQELRRFEEEDTKSAGVQRIRMSTAIEAQTTGRWKERVNVFYGFVLAALLTLVFGTLKASSDISSVQFFHAMAVIGIAGVLGLLWARCRAATDKGP